MICIGGLGTVSAFDVVALESLLPHSLVSDGSDAGGTAPVVIFLGVFGRSADAAVFLAPDMGGAKIPAAGALFEVDAFYPVFRDDSGCEHPDVGLDQFLGQGSVWIFEREGHVGVGEVGHLFVAVWVAGPGGGTGELDVAECFVRPEFCFQFSGRPHALLNVVVGNHDGGDVPDDDLRPCDVLLEGGFILLNVEFLEDGDA